MDHTLPQLFSVLKMDSQRRHDDALNMLTVFNTAQAESKSHIEAVRNSFMKGAGHV